MENFLIVILVILGVATIAFWVNTVSGKKISFSKNRTLLERKIKSKEEKIYTYIVLLIGIFITYFYFYYLRNNIQWLIYNTHFYRFWDRVGIKYNLIEGFWIFLQLFFVISWWYIRNDLIKLIKIIHSKI